MLTPLTQTAIAVLNDIADGGLSQRLSGRDITSETLIGLLTKLENGGLIRRRQIPAGPRGTSTASGSRHSTGSALDSYELARPYNEITLLQILEATGEHLNCNYPTKEEFYNRYGRAAVRLGVVNHMTRLYLAEIKLLEL